MRVLISRPGEGRSVLRCVRSDGSETWQKQEQHAAFFVAHDLTHFAVESTLGYQSAFYGLIASGWNIADTTGKGARGALPPEAIEVETLVGLFDAERASAALWTADEFNSAWRMKSGLPAPVLTGVQLAAIRKRRAELLAQWAAVPVGSALELDFDRTPLRG